MATRAKIQSFITDAILFGLASATRVRLKNSGGVLEARDNADAAYIIGRGADPVGVSDWTTKNYVDTNAPCELLWGNNGVSATTTTRFLTPGWGDATASTTTIQWRVTRAGTLSRLRIRHNTTAGNGNAIVYTLRVNSVASTLTVSIASTAADGSDLVNTVVVAVGDLVDIQVTKAASVGTSPSDITAVMSFGP